MSQRTKSLAVFVLVAAGLLAAALLLPTPTRGSAGVFRITCDFLPTYVFTLNVVGETPGVKVDLLVPTNVGCPHDYSLRPADMQKLADANVFVINGLGLDPFLDGMRQANPKAAIITISDDCDVLAAEPSEDGEHEHGTHAGHDHHHHHEGDNNPHVWVSPAQAIRQVNTLARRLSELDPAHAQAYQRNAAAYTARLQILLDRMKSAAQAFSRRNIVTFHDAFAYLARDLNLKVVATLTQDPEQAPSAHQMAGLIETIRRTGAAAIFYEPAYSDRTAVAIGRDAGVPVHPLNPFNSIDDPPDAASYETVMEQNLKVLQQALGATP